MISTHSHPQHNPYLHQTNENYAQILGQLAQGAEGHASGQDTHMQQQAIHPSLLPPNPPNGLHASVGVNAISNTLGSSGHLNAPPSGSITDGVPVTPQQLAAASGAPYNQPILTPSSSQHAPTVDVDDLHSHARQPLGIPGNAPLAPPQEGVFESRQDLLDYVRQWALDHGYIATIHHSSRDRQVTLGCDLGGQYRPHSAHATAPSQSRRRRTSSKLQNCPFKVYGHREKTGEWTLRIQDANHNHSPPSDLNRHPMARRMSDETTKYAMDLLSTGVKPRDVLAAIKQRDPNTRVLQKDIYNMKQKLKQVNHNPQGLRALDMSSIADMDTSTFTNVDSTADFNESLAPLTTDTTQNTPASLQSPEASALGAALQREREKDARIKQLESTVTILRGETSMVAPLKKRVKDLLEELKATEDDKLALVELRQSPAMQRLLARGGAGAQGSGSVAAFAGFPTLPLGPGKEGVGDTVGRQGGGTGLVSPPAA